LTLAHFKSGKTVLHVGSEAPGSGALPPPFDDPDWQEVRLDSGPPDGDRIAAGLSTMAPGSIQGLWLAGGLDRLETGTVPLILAGFRRVLDADGVALVTVPDLQAVAALVAADRMDEAAVASPAGPLTPLEFLYGGRPARRTGFTAGSLARALERAGFARTLVVPVPGDFTLLALAFATEPSPAVLAAWRNRALAQAVPSSPGPLDAAAGSAAAGSAAAGSAADVIAKVFSLAGQGRLNVPDLLSVTDRLTAAGNHPLVASLYRVWLGNSGSPLAHLVWYNLGATLGTLNAHPEAERAFRQALDLNPRFGHARFALGTELERQDRGAEAVAEWRRLLDSEPGVEAAGTPEGERLVLLALNNLGRLLENQKRYAEAEEMLVRSLTLDPSQSDVVWHWIHLRQKQCAWPVYQGLRGVKRGFLERFTSPLALLSAFDDPARQLDAARRFVETRVPPVTALERAPDYRHRRLRIAYLSSDFCLHPVAMLVVELLELHDRDRFEVYGFCWSREDGSAVRQRILRAMDHHIPINAMDDEAAARCLRDHEIDIAIDLQGLTSGCRAGILARRPAPLQVTYLGFPGVTGLPGIDHVIADRYVLPEASRRFFVETPLYLPTVFQVSDRRRPVGPRPTRAGCGLPEDAVVLCCFNNSYKFTAELFAVWMNILRRTPGAVLWLLADNEWQQQNLLRAAAARGIAPARLVFAQRTSPQDYLARYLLADLFLDTFPFNAGTTANDALWMGLPIVTCSGRTFASRMAGSLLRAVGLPELIATSFGAYEDKVVALAAEPGLLTAMRRRLEQTRATCPLFDVPRLVCDLEQALVERL
jgi:predicted O-linked N-acetylglucosamine transferase (SPINDLY family)